MPLELKHESFEVRILEAEIRVALSIIESFSMDDMVLGEEGISDPVPQTLSNAKQCSRFVGACHCAFMMIWMQSYHFSWFGLLHQSTICCQMLSMLTVLPLWNDTAVGNESWSTEMLDASFLDSSVAVLRTIHLGQLGVLMG